MARIWRSPSFPIISASAPPSRFGSFIPETLKIPNYFFLLLLLLLLMRDLIGFFSCHCFAAIMHRLRRDVQPAERSEPHSVRFRSGSFVYLFIWYESIILFLSWVLTAGCDLGSFVFGLVFQVLIGIFSLKSVDILFFLLNLNDFHTLWCQKS